MQQNIPGRDTPESNIPNLSNVAPSTAPTGSPFTDMEWRTLVNIPVQIGRAMMAVSPSGAIGTTKEVLALRKCLETIQAQGISNPMLRQLGQHIQGNMESIWDDAGHAFKDRWDAANIRQTTLNACQQAGTLLNKVSPQDAISYKEFVYSVAQKVAEAAKEGGFMGIGAGQTISPPEEALLKDLANTLGLQRS